MRSLVAPLLILFLVSGCSNTPLPETPRERLAAAEITYQSALNTVDQMLTQGLIVPGSDIAQRLGAAIVSARASLDIWQQLPDNADSQTAAIAALSVLQKMLTEIQSQSGERI